MTGGITEQDLNIPTAALLLKSTIKAHPAPVFSPQAEVEDEANTSWESPMRGASMGEVEETQAELPNAFKDVHMDKEAINREVLNLLERQVLDILNKGSLKDLVSLPGIAAKRAQYIIGENLF
jgi:hypothetical protein